MENKIDFGDGIIDEIAFDFNNRAKGILKKTINLIFDFIEENIDSMPEKIKQLRNNTKIEQEIADLWSDHLAKDGLIPKGYRGLPDKNLITNFHQDGYLAGLYVGYIIAMMALVDNNVSKDIITDARNYIRPNLVKHHYDDRKEFLDRYNDEKYSWVDKV